MWFVITPLYSPKDLVFLGFILRAFLLIVGMINYYFATIKPKVGIVLFLIGAGFFWDLVGGVFLLSFKQSILERNIGLVLILVFYLNSEEEIKSFLNQFVIFVTISIGLVGFYQFVTGNSIYDFTKFKEFGSMSYLKTNRLAGLAYETANNVSGFLMIAIGISLAKIYYSKKVNLFNFLLLVTNIVALYLTYTRAGYAAFFVVFSLSLLSLFTMKHYPRVIIILIFCAILIISYIIIGQSDLESSGQIVRLADSANFDVRLQFYAIVLENLSKTIAGNGFYSDPALNLFKLALIYVTTENIFFEWLFVFGLPICLIIVFYVFKELNNLRKKIPKIEHTRSKMIGTGIYFSFIGLIINELTTTNWYYTIIVMYIISLKFRNTLDREVTDQDRSLANI